MTKRVEPSTANKRAVMTWLSSAEHHLFAKIAESHNVTIAAYLRSIIVDALVEERERLGRGSVRIDDGQARNVDS
jgi:hypothetical protein